MLPLAYKNAPEVPGKLTVEVKAICPCGPSDGVVNEKNVPPPGAGSPGPAIGVIWLPVFRDQPSIGN